MIIEWLTTLVIVLVLLLVTALVVPWVLALFLKFYDPYIEWIFNRFD